MRASFAVVACLAVAGALPPVAAHAQDAPLGGVWTLNRAASELPRDIGFNPSWASALADGPDKGANGRGRGGRGSGGGRESAAPFSERGESYEDARRLQLLNTEARNPPARLTIVDTASAVILTNELGQARTLHLDGRQEVIEVEGVRLAVASKRDGDRLVALYHVDKDREVRYTYTPSQAPRQLVVDVQFLERGAGDHARRVYDAGSVARPSSTPSTPGALSTPGTPSFDQRPGAELRGLTSLGILVEDLGTQAVACGLSRESIERALASKLTSGGFTVRRNSDEDTYVYVNIMTTSVANGLCASRYDAFLYTHATSRLSYHDQPVLVQVSLMHRGGIGSSAPSAHGLAVVRGLEGYLDSFVTQIHEANK